MAKAGKGRFTSDMPYMNLFTPETLNRLYTESGLKDPLVLGFPVTIYPEWRETQITGSTERIGNLLDDESGFDKVYKIERDIMSIPEVASRGNNLFALGRKHTGDKK